MGRLGVHQVSVAAWQRLSSATSERVCSQSVRQDLDEAQEVIARGDPIVSLSVGAAADFAYGPTRFDFDEDGQPQAMEATEGVQGGAAPVSEGAPLSYTTPMVFCEFRKTNLPENLKLRHLLYF